MNTFKKKALLFGMLANLTTLSLTGCADQSIYCPNMNKTIEYEDGKIKDINILYKTIYDNIKVLILEYNGIVKPYLIVKTIRPYANRDYSFATVLESTDYYDLKSGTLLIRIENDGTTLDGEYFNILEEHEFMEYFIENEELKPEYAITELIEYYDTNVEPELIEYINSEYSNYTKTLKDKSK